MPIRILLADDHTVVRDGLRALLEKQPDMEVVGEAADGRDSIRLAEEQKPDVVIMDIEIDGDVATAVVGSEIADITTTYELMLVDGAWLVSCDEFNCDHLDGASPEVS